MYVLVFPTGTPKLYNKLTNASQVELDTADLIFLVEADENGEISMSIYYVETEECEALELED